MSLPARRLEPDRHPRTVRERRARPRSGRTIAPSVPRTVRRPVGFALLASILLGSMVFGIVVVNVLLAQASFHIDQVERHLEGLSEEHLELAREQATLSAPGRISAWASRHGMRLPDDIRILHAPGRYPEDPSGADTTSRSVAASEADLPT